MTRIRTKFSKNLKLIRKKKQMTQEELAESLGISVRYVQLLESKRPPNVKIDTLENIAHALKVKSFELIQ